MEIYKCNECYYNPSNYEGCHTDNPNQLVKEKKAPCLDGTWKKGDAFPLFYEMPYDWEKVYENY